MSKIILSMAVSLDASIARSDGNLDWFLSDEAFENEMLTLLRSVDAMLFGRVSYELLSEYWPTAGTTPGEAPGGFSSKEVEKEFARLMNTIPKIVYSRTLSRADWGPSRIVKDNIADDLAQMKRQYTKDIVLFAGAKLASTFINLDLIDEYRLMYHPIILKDGIPLFQSITEERPLKLSRTETFPCGVVLAQYDRQR